VTKVTIVDLAVVCSLSPLAVRLLLTLIGLAGIAAFAR
jgi:hypothetical protein